MRILILSCSIGGGHDACARAVSDEMTERGNECVTRDALRFVFRGLPAVFSRSHVWVYRHTPALFGKVYRFGETHPASFRQGTLFRRLFRRGTKKLGVYLREGGFDTVICTHVFPAMMVSDALRAFPDGVKKPQTCFIATDYTGSPGLAESDLDRYFIPDRALEHFFTVGEITPDRMYPSGIPVRRAFYRHTPTETAKERAGLPRDCRHMVMMCGSMGCGPMYGLTVRLSGELRENELLTVVCGTNKQLYRRLQRRFYDAKNVHVRSYVKDMALLMDSADLYLTKPGGISVTEAASMRLPMVFIDAVAGCEEYNKDFFLRTGGAVTGQTPKEIARTSLRLLSDKDALEKMGDALDAAVPHNAAANILSEMSEAEEEKEEDLA